MSFPRTATLHIGEAVVHTPRRPRDGHTGLAEMMSSSVATPIAAAVLAFAAMSSTVPIGPALAEQSWNPFEDRDETISRRKSRQPKVPETPPLEPFEIGEEPWKSDRRATKPRNSQPWNDRGDDWGDDRARNNRQTRADQPPTGSQNGYLPPPKPGEPLFPDNEITVERRDLAPVIVPRSSGNPHPDYNVTRPARQSDLATLRRPRDAGRSDIRPPNADGSPAVAPSTFGAQSPSTSGRPSATNDTPGWRRRQAPETQPFPPTTSGYNPKSGRGWSDTQRRASFEGGQAVWRNISFETFADWLRGTPVPLGSPTLRNLFVAVMSADPLGNPDLTESRPKLAALRAAGFYDRGIAHPQPFARTPRSTETGAPPLLVMLLARAAIASGDWQTACPQVRGALAKPKGVDKAVIAQLLLLGGACAALTGKSSGAALAGRLAREAGATRTATLDLLEAVGEERRTVALKGQSLDAIDARIAQAGDIALSDATIRAMSPSGLTAYAAPETKDAHGRILAAELAASKHTASIAQLRDAYGAANQLRRADPNTPASERAQIYAELVRTEAYLQRARSIQSFLDLARRDRALMVASEVVGPATAKLPVIPEIGWFAETAIQTLIADGDYVRARKWANLAERLDRNAGRVSLGHWRALIALADPDSRTEVERYLPDIEELARARRFRSEDLHRLVTVLDALDFQVPIGLWQAANATAQPQTGHLPPTGTLQKLAVQAGEQNIGATALLAMATLGSKGARGANILALGDAIRALKRVGLRAQARRIAVEAVFETWPRIGEARLQ